MSNLMSLGGSPGSLGLGSGVAASGMWSVPSSESFPDPFMDMASLAMPETIQYALRWCEYIFMANGTYRQASDRVLSYFITDVEISDAGDDEREKWKTFLEETLDIRNMLHIVGLDAMCYGNSFTSVLPAFKRYLSCPTKNCGFEAPLRKIFNEPVFAFKWLDYEFHVHCPKCKNSGKWRHIDRRMGDNGGFRIKRWNPHEIELLWDPFTDETAYIWKIPEDYRKMIREGHLYHLERANWEVVQACKHNNYLLFDKDVVYHMREDALSGVRNRGWGISRVLSNFRQAWYVQVLHRYNEAIALDYVIPFRLITPAPGDKSTGADPILNQDLGGFMGQVMNMIRRRRRDPASWHALPFPVQYQALGGDATQLAPRELMDQGMDTLLNSIGIPAELYKGSLTVQAATPALRLFESSWSSLPHNFNGFLRFIVKQVSQLLNWEKIGAKMKRVTHADDMQRHTAALQLMMGGQISQSTGLGSIGMDFRDEVQRMMSDQRYQAEQQSKLQEEMEQSSQMAQMAAPAPQGGGPMGPGGAPPGGGGGAPPAGGGGGGAPPPGGAAMDVASQLPTGPNQQTTPEELLSRAQYVASQIMGMPESQKDSELIKLKKVDPTLHALVRSQMNDMRQQAKTQGGAQMIAQQFGKQGSVPLPPPHRRTLIIPGE
jgi:hypothetical protein